MTANSFKICLLVGLITQLVFTDCTSRTDFDRRHSDTIVEIDSIHNHSTLRVGTLESAFSYFTDDKGNKYGYDYELVRAFANDVGSSVELSVVNNEDELLRLLREREIDIAAYHIDMSLKNRKYFRFANNGIVATKVLIQRRNLSHKIDVLDLICDTVVLTSNSKYRYRLEHLNEELGGGVEVMLAADTIVVDNLIMQVANGDVVMTIADSDIARMFALKYKNINCQTTVGRECKKAWCFNKKCADLQQQFSVWYDSVANTKWYTQLRDKYYRKNPYFNQAHLSLNTQYKVSDFDDIFREQAEILKWDWRLLAALVWNESHFNPLATSHQGAVGMMQLMPVTARKMGLTDDEIYDPKRNIEAGVRYLKRLDEMFSQIENRDERVKFILAGYNAGPGHVMDAMTVCEKYGFDPHRWEGNVKDFMLKLSEKPYYSDSVCVHGFYRSNHTIRYVDKVFGKYHEYCMTNNNL